MGQAIGGEWKRYGVGLCVGSGEGDDVGVGVSFRRAPGVSPFFSQRRGEGTRNGRGYGAVPCRRSDGSATG
jgi:hypothetical protein